MIIKIYTLLGLNILREKRFAEFIHILIILLLVLSSFFYISQPIFALDEQSAMKMSISFFANKTGNLEWDWLSTGLTDRLINHFIDYDALKIVSKEELVEFYEQMGMLPEQEEMSKNHLALFYEKSGSDVIFFGQFFMSSAEKISLSLKKYEAATGQITAFRDFSVDIENVLNFENILYDFIKTEINLEFSEMGNMESVQLPTDSIEALEYYYRSMDYRDQAINEYNGADFPSKELWAKSIEFGEKAVAEDPQFADAYFLLAEIYNRTKWTIREADSLNRFIELVEMQKLESHAIYEKASQAYFRLGYSFYAKKDYSTAIDYFNSSIKYNSNLLEPHLYLAQLYYDIGEMDLSIRESEIVLRIDPQNKDIAWLLKKSEQSQKYGQDSYESYEKGYLAYKEGNYSEAIKNLEESIAYNPEFKDSHYYLAMVYYQLADFDRAIEQWNETIKLDPFDNSVRHFLNRSLEEKKFGRETLKYFNAGYDFYLNGEYEKAIESFNRSLEMNSEFEKARKFLSRSYYQLNQMDKYREERVKVSDSVYNSEEERAEEFYKLGYEFYTLNNFEVAIEELKKALEIIPDYPAARFLLAEIYFKREDYSSARFEYNRIINDLEVNEYTDAALYGSGWSNYLLEEYSLAAERFSQLIAGFAESNFLIQAKYKLGQTYFRNNEYAQVIKVYSDFISAYPKYQDREIREIYYLLGQAYLWNKDYTESEGIFKEIIRLFPDFEMINEVKYYLGLSLFRQEKYEAAIGPLNDLVLSGDISAKQRYDSQYLLARCYLNSGNVIESVKKLELLTREIEDDDLLEKINFDLGLAYSMQGDIERAVLQFQSFIENFKSSGLIQSARYELAKNLFDLKKYQLVILELEGMDSEESLYLMGKSAEELGDREKEVFAYTELRKKFPESEYAQEAYFKLGIEYYNKAMYEKAISEFAQIVQIYPDSPFMMESYYWIGWSYYKLLNYTAAIQNFNSINFEQIEPELAQQAQFMIAESYYNNNDFSLAREQYKKYIQKYPQSSWSDNAQHAIAWTYLESEETQSSIFEFKKLIDTYPESEYFEEAEFRVAKGNLLLDDNGDTETSIKIFIDKYPGSSYLPESYYLLTQYYLLQERWMDYIILAERSTREISDSPFLPEILYGLCVSYFKKNEYKRSLDVSETYLKNYPKSDFSDDIVYISGICWEQLDNPENAINSYQKLLEAYPESTYGQKAQERLDILNSKDKSKDE